MQSHFRRMLCPNAPKSENDLKEAFAGESQANRKYLAFAKQADKEGFPQAARLFRAAAEAETVHAHNHLRALKGVNATGKISLKPLPVKSMSSRTCIRR